MPVQIFNKKSGVKLSDNFTSSEFDCGCSSCTKTLIDPELITRLERTRSLIGGAVRINSGYRCSNYQNELRLRGYETAVGPSQHQLGRAADIMSEPLTGAELEKAAQEAGFKAIGVGAHFIHVDLRDDKERRWTYERG